MASRRDDAGIVAIDAGTTETNARAALTALRRISTQPITHVILTHAHWDHIGGLAGLQEADTQVIAQAKFAGELRRVNETGVSFRYFFGGRDNDATRWSRIASSVSAKRFQRCCRWQRPRLSSSIHTS